MVSEVAQLLGIEVGDDDLDLDGDRCVRGTQIDARVEVVFIDRWTAIQPLRSEYEVDGLEHRRFADVVIADQDSMLGQKDVTSADSAEVVD